MNRTNPKLIYLGAAILLVTFVFRVVPAYLSAYSGLVSDKESLRQELIYYQNLVEQEAELKSRQQEIAGLVDGIENSIFGIPRNLLGSEVQSIIRNISGRAGVEVREMGVAKIETFEDWLKVSQELNFSIDQSRILPFLNALKAHQPRLYVRKLTISRSRQQFIGSLTIEAFSRP